MHVHKSKYDRFSDFMGQKHDQGSTCLPQTAAGPVLRSLDLAAAPRTVDRLGANLLEGLKSTGTRWNGGVALDRAPAELQRRRRV